jgi:ATP-dependent Clp protease ATP-binding subunit ClpX
VTKQYQASMKFDDVVLHFQDEAVEAIAEKAIKQKTGARGLRSIVESIMVEIMYDIPSIKGAKEVTITKDVVVNATKPLVEVKKIKSA